MFSFTPMLLTTVLIPDASLLEEMRIEEEEVLIITGGFSSQGALSSVEVPKELCLLLSI